MKKLLLGLAVLTMLVLGLFVFFKPNKNFTVPAISFQSNGEWILFSCGFFTNDLSSSSNNLYIMRADASELQQITSNEFVAKYGDWLPDGESIGFFIDNNFDDENYILSLNQMELMKGGSTYLVRSADWHPHNNTMIVSAAGSLILFDLDSNTQETLLDTFETNNFIQFARWDFTGTYIAFLAHPRYVTDLSIYIFDTQTRTSHLILSDRQLISNFTWHPNGSELYITIGLNSLYSLNIATGDLTQLFINNYEGYAEVSPSGDWIVYSGRSEDGFPQLYKARLNGENVQQLTNFTDCYVSNPRWYSFSAES